MVWSDLLYVPSFMFNYQYEEDIVSEEKCNTHYSKSDGDASQAMRQLMESVKVYI